MLTVERGITFSSGTTGGQDVTFDRTKAGKPLVLSPTLLPPLAFNITHDNAVIALACCDPTMSSYQAESDELLVGIDVMKVSLPSKRETLTGFIEMFREQLTPLEQSSLGLSSPTFTSSSHPPQTPTPAEILDRFFQIWVLKEAYTKALGLGLGFDFQRIEYDIPNTVVRVDGKNITAQGFGERGWRFFRFELRHGEEKYVGMVARFEGKEEKGLHVAEGSGRVEVLPLECMAKVEAKDFLQRAGGC